MLAFTGSLLVAVALAEVVARYRAHASVQARMRRIHTGEEQVSLGSLKRPSNNPKIVYELKPNLTDVVFRDVPVSTNSFGFRGPEISGEKPPGTIRIVGLGDSVMFGWGVLEEESYLAILGQMLEEAHPEREWQVINTSAPGYNTVMEVAVLREKGLPLEPDLVILGIVNNDLNLPTLLHKKQNYFRVDQSFLKDYVLECLGLQKPVTDLFLPVEREATSFTIFEQSPELVEPEYRDMVGWPAFDGALDDLAEMSRDEGFEVIAMTIWDYAILQRMEERCRERGFTTTCVVRRPKGLEHGTDWALRSGLRLSAEDPHPTPKLHAMIAANLSEHLESSGILDRVLD